METSTRGHAHASTPEPIDTDFLQLLGRVAAGIAEAETQLDHEVRPRVTAFLRARFGARTLRRAGGIDDLAQITMIQLFRVLHGHLRFGSWSALGAYWHAVARNNVRAGLRRNVQAKMRCLDRSEPLDLHRHDRACPPSDLAQQAVLDEECHAISAALSDVHADLFVAIVTGEPLADLAARYGVNLRTVRRWLITLRHYVAGRIASLEEVRSVRREGLSRR